MSDRTKIEVVYDPFINPELKEKINEIIETILKITLPEKSCYHAIFINQKGELTICVNDFPFSSPSCAKRQITISILLPNVILIILEKLAILWQDELNKREEQVKTAQACLDCFKQTPNENV